MEGQWQKIAALLVLKTGSDKATISIDELNRLIDRPGGVNITIRMSDVTGIHLEIVDDVEAERLARLEGGLPV
jgi:hypothetical protein